MTVHKVYWWKHNSKNGDCSSAKVHQTVEKRVKVKEGISEPKSIDDYFIPKADEINNELPGLNVEIMDGKTFPETFMLVTI